MASAQVAAQFGFQLVRRDGEWDKENPTAHPENGQRLAGYVGYSSICLKDSEVGIEEIGGRRPQADFRGT